MIIRLALVIIVLLLNSTAYAEKLSLRIYTHSSKDSVVENQHGEMIGIPGAGRRAVDVEMIRWILADLGIPNNIKRLPFKRALRKVQTEDNVLLFNVLKTNARSKTMQWVGPLRTYRSYFYEASARPTDIASIEDAKKVLAICVLSGNIHHTKLVSLGFDNIIQAASYAQCRELLERGRVDLMPSGEHPVFMKSAENSVKFQNTGVQISERDGYLGVSLNVPSEIIEKLQTSLDKLKSSPDYQDIIEKYSEED